MSVDTRLPPGIQVIELTPQRPLGLPKFPYRSLNTTSLKIEFGNLQIGASFIYNYVTCYKVANDTALSTTTGICYLFDAKLQVLEVVFPEVGEFIGEGEYVVVSGVIGGNIAIGSKPSFFYLARNEVPRYGYFLEERGTWVDHNAIRILEMNVVKKTFICL